MLNEFAEEAGTTLAPDRDVVLALPRPIDDLPTSPLSTPPTSEEDGEGEDEGEDEGEPGCAPSTTAGPERAGFDGTRTSV